MAEYYMFATRDGRFTEVKVDPAHIERQQRDLEAQGYSVTVLDQDERIKMGCIANWLRGRNR
ncbi:hypothetical protein AB0K00_40125 [Dactylosporangium sp. NPDC049525]|uniref:hypothetical protein n=1 Tax=Dactylosporangium sp. NPDC049525 TaxID=3154730 RepID=UPI0034307835